jgi:histidyl-tRNA synthetase
LGTNKSIAEALLIKASMAILADAGETDLHVEINSIGDKESIARFTREVTAYYRRSMSELPAACKQLLKKDVFALLGCDHEACLRLAADCPKSINFLSEKSRQHFKEVLEYLEALGIPYNINNSLVANRDYCSETVFEIRDSEPKSHPKAIGIRYDTLAKRLGHKKELFAVGVSLALNKKKADATLVKKSTIAKILDPQICFMQLGFEAKLKSLELLEILRKARIPVNHSLAKDKMAGQVGMAEKMQAPTVVIMGKKEAMEGSVIVRETSTRSQDSIRFDDVAAALKKYKV